MKQLIHHLQPRLVAIANRISQNGYLTALRQAFSSLGPLLMTGGFALLVTTLLRQLGLSHLSWLIGVNALVFQGSVGLSALFLSQALGSQIAVRYKENQQLVGMVGMGAFVLSIGTAVSQDVLHFQQYLGARGYFTALLTSSFASFLFCKCRQKKWSIRLPEAVPPAVLDTLVEAIPSLIALYATASVSFLTQHIGGKALVEVIFQQLQAPLLAVSQHLFPVVFFAFLLQLFWFFGIHGGSILAPLTEGVFGLALLLNMEALHNQQALPYSWTSHSYGAFVWYGILGLIIAIQLVSRNPIHRQVAKSSRGSLLFNIGESIMYGLPIVQNPIFFIPYLLCPSLLTMISYLATQAGLVAPVSQQVSWISPLFVYGFIGTGFDPYSLLLTGVNLLVATLIYLPFVKWAEAHSPEY